jgi:mono/diheme cytochrome c family protein
MQVTDAGIGKGEAIYYQTCRPCHGDNGQGGFGGGAPLTSGLTLDSIKAILRDGKNEMPAFGAAYSDEEINDVAYFVLKRLLAD